MVLRQGMAEMISYQIILYCFLLTGAYLVGISLLLQWVGLKLRVWEGIPPNCREEFTVGWFGVNLLMEFLFYGVVPTFAYSFFYLIFPLTGIRTALGGVLVAFTLGAVPSIIGLSTRVRLPMPMLLFGLLSQLLKLGGSLVIIGYLYSL